MRWFLFFAFVVAAASPIHATALPPLKANVKEASRMFWSFSRCVARRDPKAVAQLLSQWIWKEAEQKAAQKLAQRYADCSLNAGDQLKFDHRLFQGTLASAALLKKYQGRALPDYSQVPLRFTQKEMDLQGSAKWKAQMALMIMAECVFRNRTQQVFTLFDTKPGTEAEGTIWNELGSVLGACLPAEEGAELKLNKVTLRSYIGEAGYAVDAELK